MYKWKPSVIAASSIYVAKKVLKINNAWSGFLSKHTGYEEKVVRDCAKDICVLLN